VHHREISPRLRRFARNLRHVATPHEDVLWTLLRNRRFVDFKFRRQVPIGPYIADFACLSARLIVELDGGQHAESEHDVKRDTWLSSENFRVLRVWNNQLNSERDAVLEAIWHALQGAHE
jgi:very-short-patch-repair endonuclease